MFLSIFVCFSYIQNGVRGYLSLFIQNMNDYKFRVKSLYFWGLCGVTSEDHFLVALWILSLFFE